MNARENRMRIAREARSESVSSPGAKRKDERDLNRMVVNSDEQRYIAKLATDKGTGPRRYRYLNGRAVRY